MKLNWNFLGGEGVQNKNLPWGEYGYFLELHIMAGINSENTCNWLLMTLKMIKRKNSRQHFLMFMTSLVSTNFIDHLEIEIF